MTTETHNREVESRNQEYRPPFWPGNDGKLPVMGGPVGVLDLCAMLHESHTGSAPDHAKEVVDNAIRCLEWLHDNWQMPSSLWDRAMLVRLIRTLAEREPSSNVRRLLTPFDEQHRYQERLVEWLESLRKSFRSSEITTDQAIAYIIQCINRGFVGDGGAK
jgi:hypothetical protein